MDIDELVLNLVLFDYFHIGRAIVWLLDCLNEASSPCSWAKHGNDNGY
jgi:hypothetical protein